MSNLPAFLLQEGKDEDHDYVGGAAREALALIGWYREGHKRGLVASLLRSALTTEYCIHFCFAQPLFWEVSDHLSLLMEVHLG